MGSWHWFRGSQLQVSCLPIDVHKVAIIIFWSVALNQGDFSYSVYFVDIDSSYTMMVS